MTKGIRAYTNAKFVKLLPQLAELGNAGFRAKVMQAVVKKFEISVASAATHYNHALKTVRENCDRTIWLHHGRVVCDGDTPSVTEAYHQWSLGDSDAVGPAPA